MGVLDGGLAAFVGMGATRYACGCTWIASCSPTPGGPATCSCSARASGGGPAPETGGFVLTCAFPNGSLATISYATAGHDATAKERSEVLGRSRTVPNADSREVTLDGAAPTGDLLATMHATLAATAALGAAPFHRAAG